MQEIIIKKEEQGQRLDKFLNKYFPNAPTSLLYKSLRKKNITLNNKKATGNELLSSGDLIKTFFSEETYNKFKSSSQINIAEFNPPADFKDIPIVYEDEDLIIFNKPAGLLSQKSSERDYSLNEWVVYYLLKKNAISAENLSMFRPSICNRLDRNTSGLIICSKTLNGAQKATEYIRNKTITKIYRSICIDKIAQPIKLDGYLYKNDKTNKVYISKEAIPDSSEIRTDIYPIASSDKYTYLEINLHSGKSHQIRAHLSSINHPLIGDVKYGYKNNEEALRSYNKKYQLLHAYSLKFPEEYKGGLEVIAPLPIYFENLLKELNLDRE